MPTTSKQPDDSGRRLRRLASLTAAAKSLMSEQAELDSAVNEPSSMNGSKHSPASTSGSLDSAEFDTAHREESSVESVWWTPSSDGAQTVVASSSASAADKMHTKSSDSPERHGGYLGSSGRVAGAGALKQQSPGGSPANASSPGHSRPSVPAAGLVKVNSEIAAVVSNSTNTADKTNTRSPDSPDRHRGYVAGPGRVAGSGDVKQQSSAGSPASASSPGHSRSSAPAAGLAKVNSETAAVVSAMSSLISGERPGSPLGRYNSAERSDLLLLAMQQIQQLQQRVQAKKTAQSTAGATPAATAPPNALQSAGATPGSPTAVSRSAAVPIQQAGARPASGTPVTRLPGQVAAHPAGSSQLEPLQLLSPAASAALHSAGSNANKGEQYQSPTTAQAEASIESALAALQRGAPSLDLWSSDGASPPQGRTRRGSQLVISAAVQATGSPPQHSGSGTSGTTQGPAKTLAATTETTPISMLQAYSSDLYRTGSSGTPGNSSADNVISSSQSAASPSRSGRPDGLLLDISAEQHGVRGTEQTSAYDADSGRLDKADSGSPDPASISRPGTSCESHCEPRSLENSQVFADTSPGHGATAAPAAAAEATEDGGRQGPACEWSPRPSRSESAWAAAAAAAVAEADRRSSPAPSAASPTVSPEMPAVDLAAAIAAATAALDHYGSRAAAAAQKQAAAAAAAPRAEPRGFMSERSPSPQSGYGTPQPKTPAPSPALGTPRSMSPAVGATSAHRAPSPQHNYDEQHRRSSPSPAAMQNLGARQHQPHQQLDLSHEQSTANYAYSSGPAVEADAATAAKIAGLQTAADAVDQSIQEKKRAMAAAAALLASGDSGRAQAVDSDAYVATLQDLLQQLKQLEQTKQKLQDAVSRLQRGYSISGILTGSAGMSVLGEQIYAGGGVARAAPWNASPADAAPFRSSLRKQSSINDSPVFPAAPPSPGSSRGPQRTVSFKGYDFNDGGLLPPPPPPAQPTDEVLKPSNSSRSYHGSTLTRRRSQSLDRERAAEAEAAAATAADGGYDGDAPMEGYANIWTALRSRATSTVGGSPPPTRGRSGGGSYRDAYALYTASRRSLAGSSSGGLQPGSQGLGYAATGDGVSSGQAGGLAAQTSTFGSHRHNSAAEEEQQQQLRQLQQQQDRLLASASRSLMLNKAASSIRSRGFGNVSSPSTVSPTKVGANAGARQWHQNLRSSPGSTAGQQQPRQGRSVTPERSINPNRSFNARSGSTTPESSLTPQRSVTPERIHKAQTKSPWSTGTVPAAGGRYGKLGTWTAGGSSSSSKKLGAQRLGGTQQYEQDSPAQYGVGQRSRAPTKAPKTTGPPSAPASADKVGSVYNDSPSNATGSRRVTGQVGVDRRSTAEQQGSAPQQHSSRVLQQQQYNSSPRPLSHQQQQSQAQQQQLSYTASDYSGDSSARGSRGPSAAYPTEGFFLSREASTAAAGIASPRGSPRNSSSSDPKMLQLMQVLADFQAGEIREQDLQASLELVLMSKGGQQDMFMGSQQQQMLQQFWHTGGLSPVGGMSPRSSISPGRGADNPLDKWQAWQQQQQPQQQQSGWGASSTSPSRQSSRPNSMFGRQLSKMLSLVQELSASGGSGVSADERVHESNFTVYSRR